MLNVFYLILTAIDIANYIFQWCSFWNNKYNHPEEYIIWKQNSCVYFGPSCAYVLPEKMKSLNTAQKMKFSIKDFFSKCD